MKTILTFMKTILVTFLVFASIIFFSSTTFARVVTHNGDKYADTEKRLDGFVDFVHPPGGVECGVSQTECLPKPTPEPPNRKSGPVNSGCDPKNRQCPKPKPAPCKGGCLPPHSN